MSTTGAMYDDMRNEDPRSRQPEVPDLEKCLNCELMFPEADMIEDGKDKFCTKECRTTYYTTEL